MRTYIKRIGFIISSQALIPHGGIGQFAKSFCELMDKHDVKVDIIVDKWPDYEDFAKSLKVKLIYPDKPLNYANHNKMYTHKDTFNYARMENFNTAIHKALTQNMYDALICNTYESIQVASLMGIKDFIQVIAYTHLESQIFKNTINPFFYETNEMMRLQLELPGIYVGTQSKFNQLEIGDHAYHLPIPITEPLLLQKHNKCRNGVLFIGRWEPAKKPELFIELIKQTKLPARVMTSPNSRDTFIEQFNKNGITDYCVEASITGQKKVDFITESRIAFNPSIVESYGMAFYEQISQLPTFCLENQRWTNNFNKRFFFETNKKNMAKDVVKAYEKFPTGEDYYKLGALKHTQDNEKDVFFKWSSCFNDFSCKKSDNKTAKILAETNIKYEDFIQKVGRVLIEDFQSVYYNKHNFRIIYTDEDTYITSDPTFEPKEQEDDFFITT